MTLCKTNYFHIILIIIGWRRYKEMTFYAEKKLKQVYRMGCFYLRTNILDIKFIVGSEDLKTQLRVLITVY